VEAPFGFETFVDAVAFVTTIVASPLPSWQRSYVRLSSLGSASAVAYAVVVVACCCIAENLLYG
jgi:hypothetical protein